MNQDLKDLKNYIDAEFSILQIHLYFIMGFILGGKSWILFGIFMSLSFINCISHILKIKNKKF